VAAGQSGSGASGFHPDFLSRLSGFSRASTAAVDVRPARTAGRPGRVPRESGHSPGQGTVKPGIHGVAGSPGTP